MGLTIPAYAQEGICKIIKQITKRKIIILLYLLLYQKAIKNSLDTKIRRKKKKLASAKQPMQVSTFTMLKQ